jgi:hypothetical protein
MGRDWLTTTRWDGTDLLVLRNGAIVERVARAAIARAILVCNGGDTPSALEFAVLDLGAEHLLLPADSGIAACVYFERQAWWTERACIYWVTAPHAPLLRHLRSGGRSTVALLWRDRPVCLRLPAAQLQGLIEHWPLEGPQTWEQRRWARRKAKNPAAAGFSQGQKA